MSWEKVSQIGDFAILGLPEKQADGTKRYRSYIVRGPGVGRARPFLSLEAAKGAAEDFKRDQSPQPGM